VLQPDAQPHGTFLGRTLLQLWFSQRRSTTRPVHLTLHPRQPLRAGIKQGFFYDFSNYGSYDQLTTDGLTEWHPAFLALDKSLDECARKYRGFCKRYKPQKKAKKHSTWGSQMLPTLPKSKPPNFTNNQLVLPGLIELATDGEIDEIVSQFIQANRQKHNN